MYADFAFILLIRRMRILTQYYLVTFENTSTAIQAEAELKVRGINLAIMPTPTFITKSCGISIRVQADQGEEVKDILSKGEISYKAYYKKEDDNYIQVL